MKLTTCLFLCEDDFDIRKNPVDIGHFLIDGTEEQIMWKLQRQLAAVFAKQKHPDNHDDFTKELERQKEKYKLTNSYPK
jgi:hypothetical protein